MTQRISSRSVTNEQLQPVVLALQSALGDDLIALVLFGSRARGDARPDSDWDLLLVANNLPSRTFARHLQIKESLPPAWRASLAVLAKTPDEFDARIPALFLDIAMDGIVILDTDGYMAHRLAYLRRLVNRRGLFREQQGRSMVWHWQEFPGYDWQLSWKEPA